MKIIVTFCIIFVCILQLPAGAQWQTVSIVSTAGNEYRTNDKTISYNIGQYAVFPVLKNKENSVMSNFVLQDTQIKTRIKKEIPVDFRINVYPNPATYYLNVDIFAPDLNEINSFYIQVFDILGRNLSQKLGLDMNTYNAQQTIQLNISSLSTGQYFIKIISQNGYKPVASFKFLKQN